MFKWRKNREMLIMAGHWVEDVAAIEIQGTGYM